MASDESFLFQLPNPLLQELPLGSPLVSARIGGSPTTNPLNASRDAKVLVEY
jgi:hypothetical protein